MLTSFLDRGRSSFLGVDRERAVRVLLRELDVREMTLGEGTCDGMAEEKRPEGVSFEEMGEGGGGEGAEAKEERRRPTALSTTTTSSPSFFR